MPNKKKKQQRQLQQQQQKEKRIHSFSTTLYSIHRNRLSYIPHEMGVLWSECFGAGYIPIFSLSMLHTSNELHTHRVKRKYLFFFLSVSFCSPRDFAAPDGKLTFKASSTKHVKQETRIRCTKMSKNGIDLSHILLCHFNEYIRICHNSPPIPPESCSFWFFLFSLSLALPPFVRSFKTEFIWNKLAKKDDHKRDEKIVHKWNRIGQFKKTAAKTKWNKSNVSLLLSMFIFLFINYWPHKHTKPDKFVKISDARTKPNPHRDQHRTHRTNQQKKWMCL